MNRKGFFYYTFNVFILILNYVVKVSFSTEYPKKTTKFKQTAT